MRKLFYIPIVHSPEDHGSHLEEVKRGYIARYGLLKWDQHVKAVSEFWQKLREALLTLSIDYTQVRIYQDSLPVCDQGRSHEGIPMRIVEELAQHGNRNSQLLLELVKKGAMVMGSEDVNLLIEERNRHRLAASSHQEGAAEPASAYDELMERRDKYIAQRIASTLKGGEIGLLFIGALHRVVERLPNDIQVHNLLGVLKVNG